MAKSAHKGELPRDALFGALQKTEAGINKPIPLIQAPVDPDRGLVAVGRLYAFICREDRVKTCFQSPQLTRILDRRIEIVLGRIVVLTVIEPEVYVSVEAAPKLL